MSCKNESQHLIIDASNLGLKLENGVLQLKRIPFSGKLNTYHINGNLKSEIYYVEGLKHGEEKHWYENGHLAIQRNYVKGFKKGIHKAWWENGNLRFEYYFNDKGEFHGSAKEWYDGGNLQMSFNYINGKEAGKQLLLKSNGNIKANYEVVNGERFGLIGLKKCYTVTEINDAF